MKTAHSSVNRILRTPALRSALLGFAVLVLVAPVALAASVPLVTKNAPPSFTLYTERTLSPAAQAALNGPSLACVELPNGTRCVPNYSDPNLQVGTQCLDVGRVWRCRVECWRWVQEPHEYGCSARMAQDRHVLAVGVFHCPPRGVHAACDAHGAPTDGQLHAHGYHALEANYEGCPDLGGQSWTWSPYFTKGRLGSVDAEVGPPASTQVYPLPWAPTQYCPYAQSLTAVLEGSGTFGAWFEYYAAGA